MTMHVHMIFAILDVYQHFFLSEWRHQTRNRRLHGRHFENRYITIPQMRWNDLNETWHANAKQAAGTHTKLFQRAWTKLTY